jgi:Carboxypeptidase regulatory-like domain
MTSTIQGYVRHQHSGAVLAHVRVTLDAYGNGAPIATATDHAGWFAFRELAPGRYRISAMGSRSEQIELEAFNNVTVELATDQMQSSETRGNLFGKVIASDTGYPIENSSVMLVAGFGSAPDIAPMTNSRGEFSFDGLSAGMWTVRVIAPSGASAEHQVHVVASDTALVTIAIRVDGDGCRCTRG